MFLDKLIPGVINVLWRFIMLQTDMQKQYRIPLFCILTLLYWFSMYTYVPILAAYVEMLGASHKMAGIIVGSYGFTQMILRIPVGVVSDRIHKRRLFINFGMVFTLLSGVGLWLSKDLTLILVFRSLAGAAAATWVDFTVLFTSYYKHEKSTEAIGTLSFLNNIAQMLGMFAGGWLSEKVSWESPFALGAAAALLGLALSFFIVEKFEEGATKITPREILGVAKDRTLITVSSLAILSQVITFATVYGFTPVYAKAMGASKLDMALLTVFSSLPSAFASLLGSKHLTRMFGEKMVAAWGFILMGVFTVTIPFTGNFWLLLVTQVFAGIGRGLTFPSLMGLSIKDMPASRRATAMGFFQAIYGLGMFAGPVLMGLIGDMASLSQGFLLIGLIGCLSALLSWVTIKPAQKNPA